MALHALPACPAPGNMHISAPIQTIALRLSAGPAGAPQTAADAQHGRSGAPTMLRCAVLRLLQGHGYVVKVGDLGMSRYATGPRVGVRDGLLERTLTPGVIGVVGGDRGGRGGGWGCLQYYTFAWRATVPAGALQTHMGARHTRALCLLFLGPLQAPLPTAPPRCLPLRARSRRRPPPTPSAC